MKRVRAIFVVLFLAIIASQQSVFADDDYSYCNEVTAWAELYTCLSHKKDVTLAANITDSLSYITIGTSSTININLNEYTIQSDDSPIFEIYSGNVNINGPGILVSYDISNPAIQIIGSSVPTDTNYVNVTLSNSVMVSAAGNAAIGMTYDDSKCYGIVLNINDSHLLGYRGIWTKNDATEFINTPMININDGSRITASSGQAIRAEGYATWNIGKATIIGNTGIALRGGKFYLSGTTIKATGNDNAPHHNFSMDKSGDVTRTSMDNTGSAIQIHEDTRFADATEIYINGGTYTSDKGYAFCEYKERAEDPDPTVLTDTLKTFLIYDGDFESFKEVTDKGSVDDLNVGMMTEDFYWRFGDGRLAADGSASIKSYDPIWLNTNLQIRKFAKISGLNKIYNDFSWIERLLIDYTSFDGPYTPDDFSDAKNVALDEYAISKGIDYEDIKMVRLADIDPYRFESDNIDPGLLGAGKPYNIIRDLGENYPLTFTMKLVDELPEAPEGLEHKLKMLNFECWTEEGGYGGYTERCKVHELPVSVNGDEYTFTTRYFSGFLLSYDDVVPEAPKSGVSKSNDGATNCGLIMTFAIVVVIIGKIVVAFRKNVL